MDFSERTGTFVCGSATCAAERADLEAVADAAAGSNAYVPHVHGLRLPGDSPDAPARPAPEPWGDWCVAALARDAFELATQCRGVVLSLNGRVPDEGAVFRAALGFALGLPVALYKHDCRSAFHGADNAMVTGLSWPAFFTVRSPGAIAGALERGQRVADIMTLRTRRAATGAEHPLPSPLKELIAYGKQLAGTEGGSLPSADGTWPKAAEHCEAYAHLAPGPVSDKDIARGNATAFAVDAAWPPVYLSGPLFNPCEIHDMQGAAHALYGIPAFLPHRDGVERFVISHVDNAALNTWALAPVRRSVNKAIFALDIYQIAERCGAFVVNLNGRVPDEGAVVETAVALAAGLQVVAYRNSDGTPAPPLVAALERVFPVVRDLRNLQAALHLALEPELRGAARAERGMPLLPGSVRAVAARGRLVWAVVRQMRKPRRVLGVEAEPDKPFVNK